MVEELESPAEPEAVVDNTQTFELPTVTKDRIIGIFQQRQILDQRIGDMIQAVMDEKGLVSSTPPNYDDGTGVVTYTPALMPLPVPNRAARRRLTRKKRS